jgi:hypothetical protein
MVEIHHLCAGTTETAAPSNAVEEQCRSLNTLISVVYLKFNIRDRMALPLQLSKASETSKRLSSRGR